MAVNYDAIPEELRWDRQWLIAGPDDDGFYKAPCFIAKSKIYNASSTNNAHWDSFDIVVDDAESNPPCGIGYVLTENDPYSVIDLDVKNDKNYPNNPELWTSQENLDRYWLIVQTFNSYTERSASGQGLHIWVKGSIGAGLKRDGVEIYSRERFIVTTGDVVINNEIASRQDLLESLAMEIRRGAPDAFEQLELVEIEPTEDDATILERAHSADNADKFDALMAASVCVVKGKEKIHGSYQELGYPTQSEADLALMSIFTFYSKSNEQCRRLFRLSELAKRPKATKNDSYLNFTLQIIRARQAAEDKIDEHGAQLTAMLLANMHQLSTATALQAAQTGAGQGSTPPAGLSAVSEDTESVAPTDPIDWPPGFLGEMAKFMFHGAPRPVKEVAIVAALGLAAGIAGKAWFIPQSGLNLYVVLVARSAVGKEAMHSGIAHIMSLIMDGGPAGTSFVDFSDYASGPALSKAIAANTSFVNVSGEWGRKLKRLSMEDGRDGPMQQLRTVMTNLYQKSGPKSIVGGIGYSDKEKNVASVSGVAYSMIGETTPGTFYEALTQQMMEDGFMSRFTIIEYDGERPAANKNPIPLMPEGQRQWLAQIVAGATNICEGKEPNIEVLKSEQAAYILDLFDQECDFHINSTTDESKRQMWNRAHLKAYRIAALLAVFDNYLAPVISTAHIEWALDVIRRDILIMNKRITSGDVGMGDSPREKKTLSLIARYIKAPVANSYEVPEDMRRAGVVTRKYLQLTTQKSTSFITHRNGSNSALDLTIKSLIDSGYLAEMPKEKAMTLYGFHGKCYRVIHIPLDITNQLA